MALLKEDYDLSGGEIFSDIIDSPLNVNLEWKVESATDESQVVKLEWWGYVEGGDYHQLPDPRVLGKKLVSATIGNESSNDNIFGVNVAKLKYKIVPPANAVGIINIWAVIS